MTPEEAKVLAEAIVTALSASGAGGGGGTVIYQVIGFIAALLTGGGATYAGMERHRRKQEGPPPDPPRPTSILPAPMMRGDRCGGHVELERRIGEVEREAHEMRSELERLLERTANLITRLDNGDRLFKVLNSNMAKVCTGLKVLSVKMDSLSKAIDERKKRRDN